MFRIVIVLAVLALFITLIFFTRSGPGLERTFGVERWTCANMEVAHGATRRVGWITVPTGVSVMIRERNFVSFLMHLCPETGDAPGCHMDWQLIRTSIQGPNGTQVTSLTRKMPDVDSAWHRIAPVSGATAGRIIAAMADGQAMDISLWGQAGTPIAHQRIPLAGFREAMASCRF